MWVGGVSRRGQIGWNMDTPRGMTEPGEVWCNICRIERLLENLRWAREDCGEFLDLCRGVPLSWDSRMRDLCWIYFCSADEVVPTRTFHKCIRYTSRLGSAKTFFGLTADGSSILCFTGMGGHRYNEIHLSSDFTERHDDADDQVFVKHKLQPAIWETLQIGIKLGTQIMISRMMLFMVFNDKTPVSCPSQINLALQLKHWQVARPSSSDW
jgi:hypothetical protein